MIAVACTLLSAAGFYFSLGLGSQWWLAWLAPIPILWLAFGESKTWAAFLASWAAFALGGTSWLRAYAGVLPGAVLILGIGVPALMFAVAVTGARRLQRTHGPIAAMLTFAALWTAFDLLASFGSIGSCGSPATAEVGAPMLMQSAALIGFLGITFLLGAVAAGIALSLRTRTLAPAGVGIALFISNAAYGYVRLSSPPDGSMKVALIDSDDAFVDDRSVDKRATFAVIRAYAAEIERLRGQQVQLVVLPENIFRVAPEWRDEAEAELAAAANATGATVVIGLNTSTGGARCNVAWAFAPGMTRPATYAKRQLIAVLESSIFAPGPGPCVLSDGIGIEICKDMDSQRMIRLDEMAARPRLLAVPAWDFGADAWGHGRVAVLRSVENGVPLARSARRGLLTLNDRYGRLVAEARTTAGFTTLVGDLPLDGRGGATLYDRIGDSFGWLCLALAACFLGASLRPGRTSRASAATGNSN
jgi:apolipoprotein N-acyltransferase